MRRSGATVLLAAAVAAVLPAPPATAATTLGTGPVRASTGPVVGSSAYDYAPSVLQDGVYRMWWCGQTTGGTVAGDDILYAESSSLDGPFHARGSTAPFQRVFDGTGTTSFDGKHVCDPSVIRVNSTYYLFYGALGSTAGSRTSIGVASSPDGITWTRLNGGRPIVTPADQKVTASTYGAGQPSVTYVDGRFVLVFTDTTGAATLSNGAGQYVLRSADPTFQTGVETLTATGFAPATAANLRSHIVANAFSVDWQFSDVLDAYVLARNNSQGRTTLTFLDRTLLTQPYAEASVPNTWSEGPGIVSRPDRHAVPPRASDCEAVPVDLIRATTTTTAPQRLGHVGLDLLTGVPCAGLPSPTVAAAYLGYALSSSGLPLALDAGGERLQVTGGTADVVDLLTNNTLPVTSAVYHQVPFGASLRDGATVLGATGRPAAFLLDADRLWPVNDLALVTAASSSITSVPAADWDAHPRGPSLYRIRP